MANRLAFQNTQFQLARHIRNPSSNSPPEGIEDRRLAIYRDLIYNNVEGFLKAGFPVIHSILSHELWHRLVRAFLIEYRAKSPYFSRIGKEFLEYLEQSRPEMLSRYPFIFELAHYEWVELALMIDPIRLSQIAVKDSVNLLVEVPVLSPLAWPLVYEFDVQHISKTYQPTEKATQPAFIVVYRNRADDVEFTEINAVTFALLELIQNNPHSTCAEILSRLCVQIPQYSAEAITQNGLDILLKLMKRDIILGAKAT